MGGRTKRAIRSECDRFETDAEVLVLDGLVRAAVLGGSVAVGAGSTYLTRQGVYGRVVPILNRLDFPDSVPPYIHQVYMLSFCTPI